MQVKYVDKFTTYNRYLSNRLVLQNVYIMYESSKKIKIMGVLNESLTITTLVIMGFVMLVLDTILPMSEYGMEFLFIPGIAFVIGGGVEMYLVICNMRAGLVSKDRQYDIWDDKYRFNN